MNLTSEVVAGLTENALNRYLSKHHSMYPDPYNGAGESPPLDLKFTYTANKPLVCDLSEPPNFDAEFRRAVLIDPNFADQRGLRTRFDAPGVSVTLAGVSATFVAMSTGDEIATVGLSAVMNAAVLVDPSTPGRYSFFVTSIRVDIESLKVSATGALSTGCDIEKLIEHILNVVLTDRLRRFLQEMPLPQPHFVIDRFVINLREVEVEEDTLLLGLDVSDPTAFGSAIDAFASNAAVSGAAAEFSLYGAELPVELQREKDNGTLHARKSFDTGNAFTQPHGFGALSVPDISSSTLPDGDAFIAISERVFQVLADRTLNFSKEKNNPHDGGWYKYWFKNWFRVYDPKVRLISSGLNIEAEVRGGAEGGAALKGCSSWVEVKLGAEARAEPAAKLDARLYAHPSGKEIWLMPHSLPFAILVDVWMKPQWLKLEFILEIVLSVILSYFSAIFLPIVSAFFKFRLVRLPDAVPGTPVPMSPAIASLGNWGGRLSIGVKFNH